MISMGAKVQITRLRGWWTEDDRDILLSLTFEVLGVEDWPVSTYYLLDLGLVFPAYPRLWFRESDLYVL